MIKDTTVQPNPLLFLPLASTEEGSTFPVEDENHSNNNNDDGHNDRDDHDDASPALLHTPMPPHCQQQQQQEQQHLHLMDSTARSLSTQIGELVEREVGKLTRQSRMLLEDVGEEGKVSQQNSDRQVGAVVDEESKYNEDADDLVGDRNNNNDNGNGEQTSTTDVPLLDRSEIMAGSLLGNGAFSEVYQIWGFKLQDQEWQRDAREKLAQTAMSETGNCAYVLKHLRNELTQDKNRFVHAASDLVLEALFLSKFDHENIIKLRGTSRGIDTFDNSHHDGFFLILDRLDCTLSDKIGQWARHSSCRRKVYSRKLWDYVEKIDLALQIARGLDYLHDRDVLYRDLKPDNIGIQSVDGRQVVKIFDFGLCRELPEECPVDTKVFHMSGVGTRRYMAPEIFLTQYYNLKVDVYSFAIVLHCMLSLVRPFEKYNAHLHSLLVCREGVRPHIPHEWPNELQDMLRRGWSHNPHERPVMKEIRQTLERLAQRAHLEVAPATLHANDPLLPGGGGGHDLHYHHRTMAMTRFRSLWIPLHTKIGKYFRVMEHQMVRGTATTYSMGSIVSTHPSPCSAAPLAARKREPAHYRRHLRSTYRV